MFISDFGLKLQFQMPPKPFDWKCYNYLRKALFADYHHSLSKVRERYDTIHFGTDGSAITKQLLREHDALAYGAYCENRNLYLFGQTNEALQKAFDEFCRWARREEKEYDFPEQGFLFCGSLNNANNVWKELSAITPSNDRRIRVYNCGDDSLQQCYRANSSVSYYTSKKRLEKIGWKKLWENSIAENLFCEYRKEGNSVYLSYIPCQKTLQITSGNATPWIDLPVQTAVCKPLLLQPWITIGMGEILRLPDGRFILIDGGDITGCAQEMLNTMRRYDILGERKMEVAAWIITHAHDDHYGALTEFAEKYADQLHVTQFIYNIPDGSETVFCENRDNSMREVMKKIFPTFGNPPVCKIHAGAVVRIGEAQITFLGTHEERNVPYLEQMNDTCTIFEVALGGKRILFTGDLYSGGATFLESMYGSNLKCDILQVPHHGHCNSANESFFARCRAKTALIPMCGTIQSPASIQTTVKRLQKGGTEEILITKNDKSAIEISL